MRCPETKRPCVNQSCDYSGCLEQRTKSKDIADIPARVPELLREAADFFEKRNATYGSGFLQVGKVMAALFPNGLSVKTEEDWNRLHIFLLGVVKDTRYANQWPNGHRDSTFDAAVYSAMLGAIDEGMRGDGNKSDN